MKKLAVAALGLGFASLGNAALFTYTSAMNGFQEVPPTNSPGIASLILTLDDQTQTISGQGTVQFLIGGSVVGFHLHGPAPFGTNAGILVGFPNASISGNTISFSNIAVPNFAVVKGHMDNRMTYTNIHTTMFPAGEIRGQVAPIPEPATLAALGIGAAAVIGRRRRRK